MIRAFLDASVLFSAADSKNGASREIVRLGIRGHVELWVSAYVLEEARRNLATKAPEAVPVFENLLQAAGFHEASPTAAQVREIAEKKMADLNAASVETAMRMIEGTARSMGIVVEG